MWFSGDKAKVLLEEVKKVKAALREQKEATDTQREVSYSQVMEHIDRWDPHLWIRQGPSVW